MLLNSHTVLISILIIIFVEALEIRDVLSVNETLIGLDLALTSFSVIILVFLVFSKLKKISGFFFLLDREIVIN